MKRRNNRIAAMALALVCLLFALPTCASAAGGVDIDKPVSLTVTFKYGKTNIPNARISLYRVADISESATFSLCGKFAEFDGDINSPSNADEWDALALNLSKYADKNKIASEYTSITDTKGIARFPQSGESMRPGMYLLVCGDTWFNNGTYSARPCVVSLPSISEDTGNWQYNVNVKLKSGNTTEPVPTPTPTPVPKPPLPQTGVLWWPVPVLFAAGVLLVVAGALVRGKKS